MDHDALATTRRSYDRIAARFLEQTRDRSALRVWHDAFAAALPQGGLVADVGSGPGCDAAELRKRGLRVVCADLSLGMLRAGLEEFPGARVQADARGLPFADGALDGVWANASLLHLGPDEAARALREIRRALRPAGAAHVSLKQGRGASLDSERYGEPRFFQYWDGAALDAALAAAGLRVARAGLDETPRATWLVRLVTRERPGGRG
jgi:SAM-dependent methyltransferase